MEIIRTLRNEDDFGRPVPPGLHFFVHTYAQIDAEGKGEEQEILEEPSSAIDKLSIENLISDLLFPVLDMLSPVDRRECMRASKKMKEKMEKYIEIKQQKECAIAQIDSDREADDMRGSLLCSLANLYLTERNCVVYFVEEKRALKMDTKAKMFDDEQWMFVSNQFKGARLQKVWINWVQDIESECDLGLVAYEYLMEIFDKRITLDASITITLDMVQTRDPLEIILNVMAGPHRTINVHCLSDDMDIQKHLCNVLALEWKAISIDFMEAPVIRGDRTSVSALITYLTMCRASTNLSISRIRTSGHQLRNVIETARDNYEYATQNRLITVELFTKYVPGSRPFHLEEVADIDFATNREIATNDFSLAYSKVQRSNHSLPIHEMLTMVPEWIRHYEASTVEEKDCFIYNEIWQ